MRILVLTKRQYTGKDLLDDRYGRIRELPLALSSRGHQVQGMCLSYRQRHEGEILDSDKRYTTKTTWRSLNAGPLLLPGLLSYVHYAFKAVREFKPHIILACSDSLYGIIGVWIGRQTNTPCIFDLYDNFETFGTTRYSGLLPLYRWAVCNADGVICVSELLRKKIVNEYRRTLPTIVLENGVRTDIFYPRDLRSSREQLGLPRDGVFIGTAGALHKNRGINALLRGYEQLASADKRIHLAIAGNRDGSTKIPQGPRIHDLGILPLTQVPLLINSLDIAVICNLDSEFGKYCFPQKAYEILACHKPLIAANVGAMKALLKNYPDNLFAPGNSEDMVRIIKLQLQNTRTLDIPISTWDNLAEKLDIFMQSICNATYAK